MGILQTLHRGEREVLYGLAALAFGVIFLIRMNSKKSKKWRPSCGTIIDKNESLTICLVCSS